MLHGKKGFERLLYACRNALTQPVTWLFANLGTSKSPPCYATIHSNSRPAPLVDPLAKHAPVSFTSEHGVVPNSQLRAPSLAIPSDFVTGDRLRIEEFATETYEWLSLVRLQSPRVLAGDDINDYLSRYQVPNDEGDAREAAFSVVRWQGFLTSDWVRQLLVDVLATLPSQMPFALSATSFSKGTVGDSTEVTFLRPQDAPDQYFLWEIKGDDL
jgi:ribonucleases P/MRP protein subunit RPP40